MSKKALLIGINYKNSSGQLNGCINDVRNVRDFLTQYCGYNPSNIRMLTEEDTIKPTRANIESNINWLVSGNSKGDTLFFHYSGHGSSIRDTSGDETDRKDEVIIPLDYQTRGVITDDWMFANMAAKIPQGVTLWCLTDCCHSGTMIDLKYNSQSLCEYTKGANFKGIPYNTNDWTNKFTLSLEKSKDIQGTVCVFSGCQDPQTSADATIQRQSQGAFTFCLLESLKNNLQKQPNGSFKYNYGKIKLRSLLKEVNCRLDIHGFEQNSQLSVGLLADFEKTFDP